VLSVYEASAILLNRRQAAKLVVLVRSGRELDFRGEERCLCAQCSKALESGALEQPSRPSLVPTMWRVQMSEG